MSVKISAAQARKMGLVAGKKPGPLVRLRDQIASSGLPANEFWVVLGGVAPGRIPWIEVCLPWPPTVNHYYTVSRGRKVLSAEGRAWLEIVEKIAHQTTTIFKDPVVRVSLYISCQPPDHRVRDLDNLLKAIKDGLRAANIYADDYQVDRLTIFRSRFGDGQLHLGGVVTVRIQEMV